MTPAATWAGQLLRGWANQIAARYGHPVYIIGSALFEERPRDVDVVCILPDKEFRNRFDGWGAIITLGARPSTPGAARWFAEVAKLSRRAAEFHPCINVD